MKAILEIPEEEFRLELDNPILDQFRMTATRPNLHHPRLMDETYCIGEPIIIVTSNMPDDLRNEIVNIIHKYCKK